jgi:hypothetical protein
MNKKVEVSKINIKIGKKEIPLSLNEAKELRDILNDTFGKQETVYLSGTPYPVYPRPYRYWYPTYAPYVTYSGSNVSDNDTYSLIISLSDNAVSV